MRREEVIVEENNRLARVRWIFIYFDRDHRLHLDAVCWETRPTTRHKYRSDEVWSRLDSRRNTVERPCVPPGVANEARRQFCDALVIDSGNEKGLR